MNISDHHKLSKIETRNLLRHATAQSSTREVALLIGVADPRISEGKEGKWQLNIEQANKIRSEHGEPRAAAGMFVYGELWQSIEELITYATEVAKWRQWQRIVRVLTHSNFGHSIDQLVYLNNQSLSKKSDKLLALFALTNEPEFITWFTKSKESLKQNTKYSHSDDWEKEKLQDIAQGNGFIFDFYSIRNKSELAILLLLLGCLKEQEHPIQEKTGYSPFDLFKLQDKQLLPALPDKIRSPATEREMVVTGDVVWDDLLSLEGVPKQESMLQLGISYRHIDSAGFKFFFEPPLKTICQDEFNYAAIRVMLTKDLNYHMIINLESSKRMQQCRYHNEADELIRHR